MTEAPRIYSLDVLRGLALALMLLVNNPGSWSSVYSPFLHADWHGLTPTDLVFPFFLFVVGAAMACSLRQQIKQGVMPWFSVMKRAALLILIGLFLNILPFDQSPENWRFLGVLQRIGLCFLIVSIIISYVPERFLSVSGFLVLITYGAGLAWLPSVFQISAEAGPYSLSGNLIGFLDIAIIGDTHLWQGKGLPFDPEGLFSTISASVTVLSGYIICIGLQARNAIHEQIKYLLISASLLLVIGLLWAIWQPINKALWTASFVLITSALACYCLAVITLLWNTPRGQQALECLRIYGSNPIFIYVAAWLLSVALSRITLKLGDAEGSIQGIAYAYLSSYASPQLASLLYAGVFTAFFYMVALFLYRKKIFIKL